MKDPGNQAMWNQALQTVAADHPNLTLWDWPSVLASSGIAISGDNTHLPGPNEYRARSALIADDVTARMGVSRHVGDRVVFGSAAGPSFQYQPVEPTRVIDT